MASSTSVLDVSTQALKLFYKCIHMCVLIPTYVYADIIISISLYSYMHTHTGVASLTSMSRAFNFPFFYIYTYIYIYISVYVVGVCANTKQMQSRIEGT